MGQYNLNRIFRPVMLRWWALAKKREPSATR